MYCWLINWHTSEEFYGALYERVIILSILSPIFILYPVAEIEVLARKEIIVFSLYSQFFIFSNHGKCGVVIWVLRWDSFNKILIIEDCGTASRSHQLLMPLHRLAPLRVCGTCFDVFRALANASCIPNNVHTKYKRVAEERSAKFPSYLSSGVSTWSEFCDE